MRKLAIVLIVGAASLAAACKTPAPAANQQASAASGTQQASAANGERRICAYVEQTGTRLSKQECKTEREWNQWRQQGRDELGIEAKAQFGGSGPSAAP